MSRPIYEIAEEINADWRNVNYAAAPYLIAMYELDTIDDAYGLDDARNIIAYFLSNATGWRGETARRIKTELKRMIK